MSYSSENKLSLLFRTATACAALVLIQGSLSAAPILANGDFSIPTIACGTGYVYQSPTNDCSGTPFQNLNDAPGVGWTFTGGAGLTVGGTAFNTPSYASLPFTQAAFLQGSGASVSQTISGFTPLASYILSFYLGSRFNSSTDGNQTVEALVDGVSIGTWALSSFTPFALTSVGFTVVDAGPHVITLHGINSGDHTAFVSGVSLSDDVSGVPEVSSAPLAVSGMLALWAFARRRR